MKITRIGIPTTTVLSLTLTSMMLAHPAGAISANTAEDHGSSHKLVALVNSSTNAEPSAKVSLSCSSSTGKMTLNVSGINTIDANGNSFLAYFAANGVLPNVGWQLGNEAGNIVISKNAATNLWAGKLTMTLAQKADCSKGVAFQLNDQPFATGALKITGLLS